MSKLFWFILAVIFAPICGIGAIASAMLALAYPFMIPVMFLKYGRALTWDEYYRWDFKPDKSEPVEVRSMCKRAM